MQSKFGIWMILVLAAVLSSAIVFYASVAMAFTPTSTYLLLLTSFVAAQMVIGAVTFYIVSLTKQRWLTLSALILVGNALVLYPMISGQQEILSSYVLFLMVVSLGQSLLSYCGVCLWHKIRGLPKSAS